MATLNELAVFAFDVYQMSSENFIQLEGWDRNAVLSRNTRGSGFDGDVFFRGDSFAPTEIVISFRGTDGPSLADWTLGNLPAAGGYDWGQVYRAIELVADTMAQYPGVPITFTGHSLGGGLASLMATFFGFSAHIFDPAPFELSAIGQSVPFFPITGIFSETDLVETLFSYYSLYQRRNGRSNQISAEFEQYRNVLDSEDRTAIDAIFAQREARVSGSYLNGEVLEAVRAIFPTIVSTTPGGLVEIDAGETTLGGVTLHSMLLLTALHISPGLVQASRQLPALAALLLDDSLYATAEMADTEGFLNRLIETHMNEGAAPGLGILDRFADDLLRLGTDGASHHPTLRDGLMALIIEYYRFVDPTDTNAFIATAPNSIVFNVSDLATTGEGGALPGRGRERLLDAVVEFAQSPLAGEVRNAAERATDWRIHTGVSVGLATGGTDADEVQIGSLTNQNYLRGGAGNDLLINGNEGGTLEGGLDNDVLVGGHGVDVLNGGDGTDVIDGGLGSDTLMGGLGSDRLYGGSGVDNYNFFFGDGSDVIVDSDGAGVIVIEGTQLAIGRRTGENTWLSADGQLTVTRQAMLASGASGPATLVIRNADGTINITVRSWENGQLGIQLNNDAYPQAGETAGDSTPPPPAAPSWPLQPVVSGTAAVISYLDYDNFEGSAAVDRLFGLAGNDALSGGTGDDVLEGGAGNDVLIGGAGKDFLLGGEEADVIIGDQRVSALGNSVGSQYGDIYVSRTGDVIYHGLGWGLERTGASSTLLYGVISNYVTGDADIIDAGAGDDIVVSGDGDDVISGADGNDTIFAQAGNDEVQGGAGNDEIIGDGQRNDLDPNSDLNYSAITAQGQDVLHGGDGADFIVGGGNDDRLYGDAGEDNLFGDQSAGWLVAPEQHGKDYLDGGAGNDFLTGHGGNDTLYGGIGNDTLRGDADVSSLHGQYHGSDILSGDDGDDTMKGGGGADRLYGGEGIDVMYGDEDGGGESLEAQYQNKDLLEGGAGNDTLYGGGGGDTLHGGTGDDILHGDQTRLAASAHGRDYIEGGDGADQIFGYGGGDTLLGGEGNDYIEGDTSESFTSFEVHGGDHLDGGAGDDTLIGWGGEDYLIGGSGADQLMGDVTSDLMAHSWHGRDYLSGGVGNDRLWGMGGNDVIHGDEDDDQLDGDYGADTSLAGNDYLDGGIGNDQLWGRGGHDVLIGGAGTDFLAGNEGNDVLSGDDGDDTLMAGEGDDELSGGVGLDILIGGAGNDRYLLSARDIEVADIYREYIEDEAGFDTVVLLDTERAAITLSRGPAATDVLLRIGPTQQINLRNGLGGSIDAIEFGDGHLESFSAFVGRALHEQITSHSVFDDAAVFGGTQDDELTALGQNAVISGGRGNDILEGAAGATTTFVFEQGDGADFIADGGNGSWPTAPNVIRFGAGITSDSLRLQLDGIGRFWMYYGAQGDSVRLMNFSRYEPLNGPRTIDEVHFADGSVLSWAELLTRGFTVTNPDGQGYLDGTDFNDRITGNNNAGGEHIYGMAGDDVIDSGGGNDQISGGAGRDVYLFGRGDGVDVINNRDTDGALDTLLFDADITPEQVMFVRSGDSLVARILGTSDRITVTDYFTTAALDEIRFDNGVVLTASTLTLTPPPQQATAGDDVIFGSSGDDVIDALGGHDEILGSLGNDTLLGGAGNDILRGDLGADVLQGGADEDTLYGGAGDDVIEGGAGADTLSGDAGSDTYLVRRGDGSDVIRAVDGDAASIDVLRFGPGIAASDLRVSQWGTTLLLQIYHPSSGELQNQVSIEGYFSASNTNALIDELRFDDAPGVVLRAQDIQDLLFTGTEGDDVITGTAVSETLRGLGGDDSLSAAGGDDVLDGGAGNDQLAGGSGNDTYRFGRGNDRITESSGTDRIVLEAGIVPNDVQLYRHSGSSAGDLVLVQSGGPNQLRVVGHFTTGNAQAIEQIVFADGTVWDAAQIAARTVDASGTQNAMIGTSGNDVFQVDHVGDTVNESASAGTDTIESSVSYTLPTNVENLTLTGLFDLDAIGHSGANTLRGNVNMNVLDGRGGADVMIGGAGDDTYFINGSTSGSGSDDTVQELTNEGYDTVMVQSHSATLADNVERLVALAVSGQSSGSGGRWFTGNALDNLIDASRLTFAMSYSSSGTRLDGGAGADTMIGGELADTYVVDNIGDVIIERGTYQPDTVESRISYVLADNLENLRLVGASAITGTGNAFANILDGYTSTGANVLTGRGGDDRYTIGVGDTIVESANEGFDSVTIEIPTVRTYQTSEFSNIELFALGLEAGNSNLAGGVADESLIGNRSNNILEGGAGNDTLIDTKGTDSNDDDVLLGGDGNDRLTTRGGYDRLEGGAGDDELLIESRYAHAEIIFGRGQGHDVLTNWTTSSARISLTGDLSTSDVQFERDGLDLILHIADESTSLRITPFFTDEIATTIRSGAPSVHFTSGISWSAADMLRRMEPSAQPTPGDDHLFATAGADNIEALAGHDVIYAGAGDDFMDGGADSDHLWAEAGADTLHGGTGDDRLLGGSGADFLDGGSEGDTLIGGAGADTYYFENGWGSDSIYDTESGALEDAAIDEVVFGTGIASSDIRLSSSGSALTIQNQLTGDQIYVGDFFGQETGSNVSDHIERIRFADGTIWDLAQIRARATQIFGTEGDDILNAGSLASQLFGLAGNDTLNGGAGNDLLDGGAGVDRMIGGAGNDSYIVDNTTDTITETANGGTDSVQSSATFTLSADVEHLTLTGSGAINATGNASGNVLTGNSGNNTLNGGSAGTDSLIGGLGNDTYVVARASGITITENANEGTDTVQASVTFSIASLGNVENITLTGTSAINATGNTLANVLIGNSGNNTLTGGAGNDTLDAGSAGTDALVGGAGDDTYIVGRTSGITVTENANEGIDTVQSSVTFTVASLGNIENITLTGSGAINATGNTLANALIGNSGNNTLTGGAGNDTLDAGSAGTDALVGGTGNDTYIVNRATGITITENASEGTDTVQSSVTFTIASLTNLENITLTSTGAINATGNGLANALTGNAGNNTLTGAAGSDTLNGGNGADIYSYSSGHGADIINNSSTDTAQDRLTITNLTRSQMTFTRSSNDLVITRNGTTTDSIRVLNWFTVTNNQLDFVQFSDQTMTSAQINALFGSTLAAQETALAAAEKVTQSDASSGAAELPSMAAVDGSSTLRRQGRVLPWNQTHRLLDTHLASAAGELIGAELSFDAHPIVSGSVDGVDEVRQSRGLAHRSQGDFHLRARIA